MSVHQIRTPSTAAGDSLADRMARLREDAHSIAAEHTDALLQALNDAAALDEQVAAGGEAYDVGVREIARRTHADLASKILSLRAIRERVH